MAKVLSLYTGATLTLNLLTGDALVRSQGWQPQIGGAEDGIVWDTFEIVGRASTNALYLAALYNIQKFITDARDYHTNPSLEDPCWIYFRAEGGEEVRALVFDGNLEMPGEGKMGAFLDNAGAGVARLALARSYWWERTSALTVSTSAVSNMGGEWAPTVTSGNLPGRIRTLKITGNASNNIDDVWVGVKPTYEGTASFNPLWEAESGTNGTDAADAVDASASGGNRVTVSFATSSAMVERFRISVSQILGSNYTHMIGSYTVLGRVKSSSAVTSSQRFLIRTYQGLLTGETELTGETAFTPDTTTWRLVELGYFRVPPTGYRFAESTGSALWCKDATLYIYAQRLSGTASLYFDCLILIPTEPVLTIKTGGMNAAADYTQFYSSPAGDTTAVVYDAATTSYSTREHTPGGPLVWPIDGGVLVYASQQAVDSKLSYTSDFEITYYPRYSIYRIT